MAFKRRLTAGLAALSDPDFDPLTNGREALGLPLSAGSVDEMAEPAFLERLFQWRSLVAITRVGASNTAPEASRLEALLARQSCLSLGRSTVVGSWSKTSDPKPSAGWGTGAALDKARAAGISETEAWNGSARLLYTTASTHVRYFLLSKVT